MADWWDIDELGELPRGTSAFDSFDDMPISGPNRALANKPPATAPPAVNKSPATTSLAAKLTAAKPPQKTVAFSKTNAYFAELDEYYENAAPHPISSQYVPRKMNIPTVVTPSLLEIVKSIPSQPPNPEPPECVMRHYTICLRTMELRQGTLDLHANLAEPIVVKYKHTCQTRLVTVSFWLRHQAAGTMIIAPDDVLERTPWGFFQMVPLD